MNEKIISIQEIVKNVKYGYYEGIELVTDKNIYQFLISGDQQCCECAGYMYVNDEEEVFNIINKTLHSIITHEPDWIECDHEEKMTAFIDIKTTDGYVLQIAVYNQHNGYYGHSVKYFKNDVITEEFVI